MGKRELVALLCGPGLEVIKLEYSLKLKIKRNDWLLADTCRVCKQPTITLYFELENEFKFYHLEAWCLVIVIVLWLFLTVPCMNMVFPNHTHLLFC